MSTMYLRNATYIKIYQVCDIQIKIKYFGNYFFFSFINIYNRRLRLNEKA